MKLQDQVLTIDQVRGLQELGFNIEKYASMCWNKTPTLTIGDIMDILPLYIKDKRNRTFWREITSNGVLYYRPKPLDWVFNTYYENPNKPLIEALFETLKWCIEEKHIAL